MSGTVFQFIIALVVTDRLRKFFKKEGDTVWAYRFQVLFFASIGLLVVSSIIKLPILEVWFWNIYVGGLLYLLWTLKELSTQRKLFWAILPAFVYLLIESIFKQALPKQYDKVSDYVDFVGLAAIVWMIATIYGQNKLNKVLEEEKKKRAEEEAKNRAIALRKVELEDLVAERTAEIMAQKESLEKALSELQETQKLLIQSEKMASLGELTAGIAHEIQNPLNFVNNFSELNVELMAELSVKNEELGIKNEDINDLVNDISANSEKINHHGKRAAAIVKGMLQHSRTSSGQKEPTDINALCDEYLRLAYHGLRAKDKTFNAKFETHFDENLPKVNVVSQDMGRVVLNIINNAFFAVKQRQDVGSSDRQLEDVPTFRRSDESYTPLVTVSTKTLGNTIEITIADNGTGIPAEIKEKIFQPFFTTKPTGQGTGLGLSLSYDIIKAHGGKLEVDSEMGKGTRFVIVLPVN